LIGGVLQEKLSHQPGSKALLTLGENQYVGGLAAGGPALRQRLVVCLHQPPSWFKLHWHDNATLQGLGAIVCLSSEAADYLQSITPDPVFKIRHGVALDFCQPTSKTAPLPTPKTEPPPTRSGASFPDWFRLGCAGGASVCSWFAWLVALVVVCH
jgi:hypothetical protein